jgi:hypothetical protein
VEDESLDQQKVQNLAGNLNQLNGILTQAEIISLSEGILLCFMPGRAGRFPTDFPEAVQSVVRKLTDDPPAFESVVR